MIKLLFYFHAWLKPTIVKTKNSDRKPDFEVLVGIFFLGFFDIIKVFTECMPVRMTVL